MNYRAVDGSAAPIEHFYTNQTAPYFRRAAALRIARAVLPRPARAHRSGTGSINVNPKYFNDTSDAIFQTTRGGDTYDRTFLGAFVDEPRLGAPELGLSHHLPRPRRRANRSGGNVMLHKSGLRAADLAPAPLALRFRWLRVDAGAV